MMMCNPSDLKICALIFLFCRFYFARSYKMLPKVTWLSITWTSWSSILQQLCVAVFTKRIGEAKVCALIFPAQKRVVFFTFWPCMLNHEAICLLKTNKTFRSGGYKLKQRENDFLHMFVLKIYSAYPTLSTFLWFYQTTSAHVNLFACFFLLSWVTRNLVKAFLVLNSFIFQLLKNWHTLYRTRNTDLQVTSGIIS